MRFVLFMVALTLTACGPEDYRWNQRMTVVVETPEGIVTGSSLVEVSARLFPNGEPVTGNIASFGFRGEAVAVEIREGEWLFALLHEYPAILLHPTRPDLFGDISLRDYRNWIPDIPDETEPVAMPQNIWPRFVTFADIEDPSSVEVVNPDSMTATFGDGVRLVEVQLEVTQAESTGAHIQAALPWLCDYLEPYRRLDGQNGPISGNRLVERLGPGSFFNGDCV